MSDGISMDPAAPKPPSRRAKQRARREKAKAEGQCVSPAKSTGKRCKNPPVEGRATCGDHGGKGGRPIVHGRFAECLTGRVKAAVQASVNDETLFDHAQTVGLLDGLLKEACARASDLDVPEFRKQAVERVQLIEALLTDGKDVALAVHSLAELLRKGLSQAIADDRVFRLAERIDARIAERNRIALAKQNSINSVDLVGVMQGLLATIQRLAPPDLAKSIADELEKLLGGVDIDPPSRETIVGRG